MKKFYSILFLFVMVISTNMRADQYYYMSGGIKYSLNEEDSTAMVVDNWVDGDNWYTGDIVIPEFVGLWSEWIVTSIQQGAFNGSWITSVTMPNTVITIGWGVFYNCEVLNTVVLSNNITSIQDYTFCYCNSLVSVNIPEGVTYIGNMAFAHCRSLPLITLPQSTQFIADSAFVECSKLTSVALPENVISIGDGAFRACSKLTYLTIPESVISIGDAAFAECSRLMSITNYAAVPQTISPDEYDGVFAAVDKVQCTLYVPETALEAYRNAVGWRDFMHIEPIRAEGVDQITNDQLPTTTKILRDGQILILRGDKTYTLQGQELK